MYQTFNLGQFQLLLIVRQDLSPTSNCMFKVNNRNTGTRWEICSKLTIKTPERRQWRRSGVFIVNCEHISHFLLVFLLLTLSRLMPAGSESSKMDYFLWWLSTFRKVIFTGYLRRNCWWKHSVIWLDENKRVTENRSKSNCCKLSF